MELVENWYIWYINGVLHAPIFKYVFICTGWSNPRGSPDLCEVDGEDGVRAAADVVHAGAGGGAVDVSGLHQLLDVAVVLHQVFGQI